MSATPIEWTDHSVNPLRARLTRGINERTCNSGHYCEKISPGCLNCYSSKEQPRFGLPVFKEQRGNPDIEHFLDASKLEEVLRRKKPTKWFWCDMTDMFGSWVPFERIAACFGVMAATPWHTHQVLTKRSERLPELFEWLGPGALDKCASYADDALQDVDRAQRAQWFAPGRGASSWPLQNLWLGVSCENRAALPRLDDLRKVPAAVRFVSFEPLLEDLGDVDLAGIHWAIPGGESGLKARPCHVEWIRSLVRRCGRFGTAPFVKQLGANVRDRNDAGFLGEEGDAWDIPNIDDVEHNPDGVREEYQGAPVRIRLKSPKGGDPAEWCADLRVREFPQ